MKELGREVGLQIKQAGVFCLYLRFAHGLKKLQLNLFWFRQILPSNTIKVEAANN